jgi:cell division protein FtsL
MDILALVIAVIALVVATEAFSLTGGIAMLQQEAEEARLAAANALGRVEELVRPQQEPDATATPEGAIESGDGMRSGRTLN